MIYRFVRMAIDGLTGKADSDGTRTTWLVAVACVAVVVGLIIFRITCPDAARAVLNGLRFVRHIH